MKKFQIFFAVASTQKKIKEENRHGCLPACFWQYFIPFLQSLLGSCGQVFMDAELTDNRFCLALQLLSSQEMKIAKILWLRKQSTLWRVKMFWINFKEMAWLLLTFEVGYFNILIQTVNVLPYFFYVRSCQTIYAKRQLAHLNAISVVGVVE